MHSRDRTWRTAIAWRAYRGLATGALPLALPAVAMHPHVKGGTLERLGLVSGLPERPVWFHGASAGDVTALRLVAERMAGRGVSVAFSCWTRSGRQTITAWQTPPALFYLPLDTIGGARRLLRRLNPRLLVLEGLEIWPNLLAACAERRVPVVLINGRLSEASTRAYRRLRWLFEPCFRSLRMVVALDQRSADRFVEAGALASRVCVGACTKHLGLAPRACSRSTPPKLIIGSIHAKEARKVFPLLAGPIRSGKLSHTVIVPRYPAQARTMQRQLRRLGVPSSLDPAGGGRRAVEVVDRMGGLRQAYGGASVAFVGGSLVRRGGHNVVEAACQGVPVLVGPHHDNCRAEIELLRRTGGASVVADATELVAAILRFVDDDVLNGVASRGAVQGSWQLADAAALSASRLGGLLEGLLD